MQRSKRAIQTIIGPAILSIAVAFLFYLAIIGGPMVMYDLLSPASSKECAQVRKGMTRREVLAVIHRATPPFAEHITVEHQMVFGREENACVVEFDPEKDTVINARLDPTLKEDVGGEMLSQ